MKTATRTQSGRSRRKGDNLGVEMSWDNFVNFVKLVGFDLEGGIDLGNGQKIGVKVRPETAAEREARGDAERPAWAKTLGVKRGWSSLTRAQLNARRRELARKYHPDQYGSDPKAASECADKLRRINTAFDEACADLGLDT